MPESRLGVDTIAAARVDDAATLETVIQTVAATGRAWGELPGAERAAVLHRAGLALAANRDRLIEVMAAETGKTIAEADPEISEAIDFAHYYAERARELDHVQGAVFVPPKLTVVTPPWNFPVAIPAGGVLAALAAGSGVIIKPAKLAQRSGAVMVEALWEAGVPRELLALVDIGERRARPAARRRTPRSTGSSSPARTRRRSCSARSGSDLPLLAETSGKNAIIVTPSADLDLAASDVVKSAFGHAGQKCSAASLVILVGSVAKSERFRRQLVDAATSLRVGYPEQPQSADGSDHRARERQAAARAHPARHRRGVARRAEAARRHRPALVARHPRRASPPARTSTSPSSSVRCSASCTPRTSTRRSACRTPSTTASPPGLHSLDPEELAHWFDRVEAGNLYVNRGITGAIVQRQPFGGWKRSAVGAGAKAGGPNYLFGLGEWMPQHGTSSETLHLRGLEKRVTELIEASQPSLDYESFEVLRRSALSDEVAWAEEYGVVKDVSGVGVERNLFRYRPLPVTIRIGESSTLAEGLRVIAAGLLAKSALTVSTAIELPKGVRTHPRRARGAGRPRGRRRLARARRARRASDPRACACSAAGRPRSPRRSAALRMSRCGRTR